MIYPQVVLIASSAESTISAWCGMLETVLLLCPVVPSSQLHTKFAVASCRDVHTSTFLTAFKSNASGRNALSLLGRDYLVAAQQPKGVLHFWAWHKARLEQSE